MADLVMKKRRGREGEIGLFIEAEVFEEQFGSIKMDTDVSITAVVPAHAKYNKFSWVIAGLVKDNREEFDYAEEARDAILIDAKHYKKKYDTLRNKGELKPKPTHNLTGDQWLLLIRRMVDVAVTIYGIPESALSRNSWPTPDPEPPADAKKPKPRATRARKAADAPSDSQLQGDVQPKKTKAAPQTSEEYVAACREWLKQWHSPAQHEEARSYFDSEVHVGMRQRLGVSDGVKKMLHREIDQHFTSMEATSGESGKDGTGGDAQSGSIVDEGYASADSSPD